MTHIPDSRADDLSALCALCALCGDHAVPASPRLRDTDPRDERHAQRLHADPAIDGAECGEARGFLGGA